MTGMIASIDWSAPPAIGHGPVPIGYGITSDPIDGYVIATTANLAVSPSRKCEGIAVSSTDGTRPFSVLVSGRLSAAQAFGVGAGNGTDFAILNSAGLVVRSAAVVQGLTVGVCAADGSVDLGLGAISVPGVQGDTGSAATAASLSQGYAIVMAGDPIDSTKVTPATLSARAISNMAVGIAVAAYGAGAIATYAKVGARISTAITGLGAGTNTIAVADSVGRPVRKDAPDPGDLILGTVDANGTLNFFPYTAPNSNIGALNPSLRGATDFSLPVADVLQRRIESAYLNAALMGLNSAAKRVDIESGWFNLDHPLHMWRAISHLNGVMGCTHLFANNWAGPVILVSSRREPPFLAVADFAGGNAMVLDAHGSLNDDKWLELSEYGAGVAINGWAQFEVSFIVKKTQAGVYGFGGTVISSGGSRYASDFGAALNDTTLQTAFYVNLTSGTDGSSANSILFEITTLVSGSPVTTFMFAPANSLTVDGNYHLVKCNYDGANMRIIVDNVVVATVAKTGTMLQRFWEHVVIGRGIPYLYNTGWDTNPPFANLADIQVRDTVSQTASGTLTLPVAKQVYPPVDPHVSLALNFDDFFPPLQVRTVIGATNTTPVTLTLSSAHGLNANLVYPVTVVGVGGTTSVNQTWDFPAVVDATHINIPIPGNGAYTSGGKVFYGGTFTKGYVRAASAGTSRVVAFFPTNHLDPSRSLIQQTRIEDLTISAFYGDAILAQTCPITTVRRVNFYGKGGVRIYDDCYETVIEAINVTATGNQEDCRTKCYIGPAGYMSRISQSSFYGGGTGIVAAAADISIQGVYIAACWRAAMFYSVNTLTWYGTTSISDESAVVGKTDDMVALIACANVHFSGIQFTADSAVHCIVVDQVHTQALVANVVADGCTFAATSPDASSRTVNGLLLMRAGHGNPAKGSMHIDGHVQVGTLTIPWIDPATDPAYPILIDPRGRIGTKTISIAGLTSYAMTRDDQLYSALIFSGALAADCTITTPTINIGKRDFIDATTGAHNVFLKTAGGSNVLTVPKSPSAITARYDGTEVRNP